MRKKRVVPAALVAVVAIGVMIASLGGSAAASSAAPARAATTGLQAARQLVTQYSGIQKPITIPVLPKRPSRSHTVGVIYCTIPACTPGAVTQSIATIGWKADLQSYALTPTAYVQAWGRVMQNPPQSILAECVFPDSLVANYLAQAAKLKIPVVCITSAEASLQASLVSPVEACEGCQGFMALDAKIMAAVIAANAGGPAAVGFVEDPSLVGSSIGSVGFGAFLNAFDPGSSVDVIQVSAAAPASQNAATVVAYVQSHPDVKYLAVQLASLDLGVPQALAAAGLGGNVKIVSRAPTSANLANIKAGGEFAEVADEDPSIVWRGVNALARIAEGLTPGGEDPVGWKQIVTKANVGSVKTQAGSPLTPGYPQAFLKAWHVSKIG